MARLLEVSSQLQRFVDEAFEVFLGTRVEFLDSADDLGLLVPVFNLLLLELV